MKVKYKFDYESLCRASSPCYIIAEIGVNHGGNAALAMEMVLAAKKAGADAVKFQTFSASRLATKGTKKVLYQKSTTTPDESHYEMLRSLEFKQEDHLKTMEYCAEHDIDFISTPYDVESARFLNDIGIPLIKTASADIVDLPLHQYLAGTQRPVIISTGMATLGEIEKVVNIYRSSGSLQITLLHAVCNYPCSDESLNLRVIRMLHSTFNVVVGFSDHSVGVQASSIAVALDAKIIEKHFTLDKDLPGPDHKASCTPEEFAALVKTIRKTERILGSEFKTIQEEERQMAQVSRKSIVTAGALNKGTILTLSDLIMKRPGTGLPPAELPNILGRSLRRDLPPDYLIQWTDLE